MSNKDRITGIGQAPITWKERDLLTASEKYMKDAINFSLIEFVEPCFPKIETTITQKIAQVWAYTSATYHLIKRSENVKNNSSEILQLKAARIYEQEAQRILGSIFPMEDKFWKAFYTRQELEITKPLIAIDAIHFSTHCQEQIAYQLLLQSLKAIIQGYYSDPISKKIHFENAKRLLMDLPITPLQSWLSQQLV